MNINDLTISGVNQVSVLDSLESPIFKIEVERNSNTIEPQNNQLVIFVDKNDYTNPTDDLRQYVYELQHPLKYLNNVSDKFVLEIKPREYDVILIAKVKRYLEEVEGVLSPLVTMEEEIIESFPICLFEGENYIYTNYINASIEVIYPKNNDFTKLFLNNAIYYNHKIKNDGEFCLDDIYFKDAFTKTEDKLNIEVDNACISCLTSKNNSFSLDDEGNLIVNSINFNELGSNVSAYLSLVYPVGSIYMSVSNTNPSLLFGGTWEQLKDKFLLCAGDTYTAGSTGGEATHKLTISEMPSHTHELPGDVKYFIGWGTRSGWAIQSVNTNRGGQINLSNNGGNTAHNNMPPYLSVYVWKRIG